MGQVSFAAARIAGEPAMTVIAKVNALCAGTGFAGGVAAIVVAYAARADGRGDARKPVGASGGAIIRGRSSALCHHHVHPPHCIIAIDRRAGGRDMIVDASHIAVGVVDIRQIGEFRRLGNTAKASLG